MYAYTTSTSMFFCFVFPGQSKFSKTVCSLGPQHRNGAVSAILPEGQEEGEGCSVEQRRTPIFPLLFGVDQVQHDVKTAPLTQQELLQGKKKKKTGCSPAKNKNKYMLVAFHTFDPSFPSFTSRLRKSSIKPGWVSTATVRNSRIMTFILMSSVLLCSRVRNASLMAAASLPRQA